MDRSVTFPLFVPFLYTTLTLSFCIMHHPIWSSFPIHLVLRNESCTFDMVSLEVTSVPGSRCFSRNCSSDRLAMLCDRFPTPSSTPTICHVGQSTKLNFHRLDGLNVTYCIYLNGKKRRKKRSRKLTITLVSDCRL